MSVLPLHHTFEFSTGFLTPLSRGAQITYLPELTSDASRAHQERPRDRDGRRAGAVGTAASPHQDPALRTQRLDRQDRRRLDQVQRLAARQHAAESRARSVFYPIHEGLGGRIRYFISGGSALSEKIQQDFQGLGFTILEGYGLTEASPVLTVTRPENRMLTGSVGRPLAGRSGQIAEPEPAAWAK